MPKLPKHLTVVYTINDPKAFEPIRRKIFEDFGEPDGKAFAATAVSLDHEAASSIDSPFELHAMIEHISGHPDIGNVSDLKELQGS